MDVRAISPDTPHMTIRYDDLADSKQADSRLRKLARIIALLNDPAASDGERANCRMIGERMALALGVDLEAAAANSAAVKRFSSSTLADAIRAAYRDLEVECRMQQRAQTRASRGNKARARPQSAEPSRHRDRR